MLKRFLFAFDGGKLIETYLAQCQVRNPLAESKTVHVPPTPDEVKFLIGFLRSQKLNPMIVGSVAILRHLGPQAASGFRPTVDLDVWVTRVPEPPQGWRRDPESPGVISWIAPSGGYVDFLTPGHEYAGTGAKNPARLEPDPESAESDFPVAHWKSLLFMKLNSMREKDLADCVSLVRALKRVPSPKELGKLNQTQRENLDLVTQWFKLRPQGKYGE